MTITHADNFYTAHAYGTMAMLFGIAAILAVIIGIVVLRYDDDETRSGITTTGKIVTALGLTAFIAVITVGFMATDLRKEVNAEFNNELQSQYGLTTNREFSDMARAPQPDGSEVTDIRVNKNGTPATITMKVHGDNVTLYELDGTEIPRT